MSKNGGKAGIAWRNEGQKDFAKGQVAEVETDGGDAFQNYEVEIPEDRKVIHFRFFVPPGAVKIEAVEIFDLKGKMLRRWRFGPK
jgi:hypothetical protein